MSRDNHQPLQQECLDHFIVCGERHFGYLIREYVEHYHRERPHQGLGNAPPTLTTQGPAEELHGAILRRTRLGGLLKHYERVAV